MGNSCIFLYLLLHNVCRYRFISIATSRKHPSPQAEVACLRDGSTAVRKQNARSGAKVARVVPRAVGSARTARRSCAEPWWGSIRCLSFPSTSFNRQREVGDEEAPLPIPVLLRLG